ncbi:MAG: radical SAM protein [Kiritimatiellae bacterium]|nr:radical SAM protein [Kiritimatiellia bacterium]
MTSVSKLLFGNDEPNDRLRYAEGVHGRPVVVWNVTAACNLRCAHCYAAVDAAAGAPKELSTEEAFRVVDDLAAFKAPVLLFSGGEPFLRQDVFALAERAKNAGLRVTFSTNGTLIDDAKADRLAALGVGYVGVSVDGTEQVHDAFRRRPGAYRASLAAIRRLLARGVKVGLRVTLTRHNVACIPALFELLRAEGVPRICLYHLVYTGRGAEIAASDLSAAERRAALDAVVAETRKCFDAGKPVEVLTVDNHCDGPYLYERACAEGPGFARRSPESMLALLKLNGGNASGSGIASISWDGTVFPDQFWRNRPVGNVRAKPFSEIWGDPPPGSLLAQLRERRPLLPEKCRACKWLSACNGNFRARGEAVAGDAWGMDPACYL